MNHQQEYINILMDTVYKRISTDINGTTIDKITENNLVKSHLSESGSVNFQKYYFSILNNEQVYFKSTDFFKQFKKQYSLQGIDNNYLNRLEGNKVEILKKIRDDNLTELYFETFRKAKIKHGKEVIEKDLGSFFAKLVHTFQPSKYCALDNPVKDYFGLKNESFFIAFHIISLEYRHWANQNSNLLKITRKRLEQLDKKKTLNHNKLTDLKLMDLIFWSKANNK